MVSGKEGVSSYIPIAVPQLPQQLITAGYCNVAVLIKVSWIPKPFPSPSSAFQCEQIWIAGSMPQCSCYFNLLSWDSLQLFPSLGIRKIFILGPFFDGFENFLLRRRFLEPRFNAGT